MNLLAAETRADIARTLVLEALFGTPYSETALYALERAILGDSDEYRISYEIENDQVVAIALFGTIAGTVGTARLFLVAPVSAGAASVRVIDGVVRTLQASGHRLLIAELPDDAPFAGMRKLLLESGFQEESRIEDLIRPGVALTFLRCVIAQVFR